MSGIYVTNAVQSTLDLLTKMDLYNCLLTKNVHCFDVCISRVEKMPHGNKNTDREILVWYGIKSIFYSLKSAGCLIDHIIGKNLLVSLVWAAFKILRSVFKITGKTCVTRKPWFKILQKQESEVAYGTAVSQADISC